MKRIVIIFFLFLNLLAQEKQEKITIGTGIYSQTQPYKGVQELLLPSPIIFFDNSIFYMRWTRVGLYFLGEKEENYAWAFSLTVMPRTYGYSTQDIEGMQERKSSWEGGLSFSGKLKNSYIEIMLLTDILDRSDTYVIKTDIGYEFKIANFTFYPSLNITYQSSSFTNYYYGVEKTEIMNNRVHYIANSGYQLGVQTYIEYPITQKFSTFINLKVDKLSNEAQNSPLVIDKYIYSGLLSFIYTFHY